MPWALVEQFLDPSLAEHLGVRIVRIATHPKATKLGYGSRAVELLSKFFDGTLQGKNLVTLESIMNIDKTDAQPDQNEKTSNELAPKKSLAPLLKPVEEVKPIKINYISVSFGLTRQLYNFWAKNEFQPFCVKLSRNEITGEHNCMIIKPALDSTINTSFLANDFRRRLVRLLPNSLIDLEPALGLALLDPNLTSVPKLRGHVSQSQIFVELFSELDLKRLESYSKNLSEHFLIKDLVAKLAELFFLNYFPDECALSYSQALILSGVGLQAKTVEYFADTLKVSHA